MIDEPGPDGPTPTPGPIRAERTNEQDIPGARMASLTAYVQTHRDRYTEASLRRASLEAGYTQAEVDAAWRGIAAAASRDAPIRPRTSLPVIIGTTLAFIGGTWLAVVLVDAIGQAFGFYGSALLIWVGAGIVGVIGWATQRDRRPSVAQGLGCGVLLIVVLPIVLFLAVLGFCLATGFSLLGN
ncbi:MAG TPA: hypothetical protein VD763_02360 [Candidatus Saccharimonadales bacterium]|nr:hypothetical protein [Candidatus Saccharimonadales bacterium]